MQVKESIQEEKKAQGWQCTGQEGETSLTHFSGSERGALVYEVVGGRGLAGAKLSKPVCGVWK